MANSIPGHFTLTVVTFALTLSVLYGYQYRTSHSKSISSCSLNEYSKYAVSVSAVGCAAECLADQDAGGCAAYQWDADTRACHLQKKLNVTASTAKTVSVVTNVLTVCANDTDCPVNEECVNQDCPGLNVCVAVSCPVMSDEGSVDCSDDDDCPQFYTCVHQEPSITCVADDCSTILNANPASRSGLYVILVGTRRRQVWCDMDTDGGGWTVFLKRLDGSVDFDLELAAYQQGFGDVCGEYWLGLDDLHSLTSAKTYELRADISDWEGASVHSLYASILVADESENYTLTCGSFLGGGGGDALSQNNGMQFSAKDFDRDKTDRLHCAEKHLGGFWYKRCSVVYPTGKYYIGGSYTNETNGTNNGIQWRTWPAHFDSYYSMKTVSMKIRPQLESYQDMFDG